MTYTHVQHQSLAQAWARWNGQRGTEKQVLRITRHVSAAGLHRMLLERGVAVPDVSVMAGAR